MRILANKRESVLTLGPRYREIRVGLRDFGISTEVAFKNLEALRSSKEVPLKLLRNATVLLWRFFP
jgi:hypothetical protein